MDLMGDVVVVIVDRGETDGRFGLFDKGEEVGASIGKNGRCLSFLVLGVYLGSGVSVLFGRKG